jgi:hypothetical protein
MLLEIAFGCLIGFCGVLALAWWRMSTSHKLMVISLGKLFLSLLWNKCLGKKLPEAKRIGNTLHIHFLYNDEMQTVFVPYDEADKFKYTQKRVFMIKQGEKTEITQMAGVPYLITANDFEADTISVYSVDEGEEQVFDRDTFPRIE